MNTHNTQTSARQWTGEKNESHPNQKDLSVGRAILACRATVHASTVVSLFKMPTDRKMRVLFETSLPTTKVATSTGSKFVLLLKEGIRRTSINHVGTYGCRA